MTGDGISMPVVKLCSVGELDVVALLTLVLLDWPHLMENASTMDPIKRKAISKRCERDYFISNKLKLLLILFINNYQLLRRPGDVESSVQTDTSIMMEDSHHKRKSIGGSGFAISRERIGSAGAPAQEQQLHNKVDSSTQVTPDELPEFESAMLPHIQQLVDHTMEQAFIEALEEEELKEIKRKRIRHLEAKMAELTTSRLMNVPE